MQNIFKEHKEASKANVQEKIDRREKIQRLEAEIAEEERRLKNSRENLERKARLYDKMAAGKIGLCICDAIQETINHCNSKSFM